MRRLGATLTCCAILLLLLPAPADALFWRWLDELSGPGPFNGFELEARLYCFPDREAGAQARAAAASKAAGPEKKKYDGYQRFLGAQLPCFNASSLEGPRKASINLTGSYNWAKDSNLDYGDGRDHKVHYIELRPSVWVRPARSIDVGAGVSWLWFRGDRFESFSRVAIEPVMVDIKPFALWHDLRRGSKAIDNPDGPDAEADLFLTFRTGVMLLPKGFTGRDFGAPQDPFAVGHEWLPTFSVLIDLDFLRRRAH